MQAGPSSDISMLELMFELPNFEKQNTCTKSSGCSNPAVAEIMWGTCSKCGNKPFKKKYCSAHFAMFIRQGVKNQWEASAKHHDCNTPNLRGWLV